MNEKENRVRMVIWADSALREQAKLEARRRGLRISRYIERLVQQDLARASSERALAKEKAIKEIERRLKSIDE